MRRLLPILILALASSAIAHEGKEHATITWQAATSTVTLNGAPVSGIGEHKADLLPGVHEFLIRITVPHPEPDVHPDDPIKKAEHLAMLALVPRETASLYVAKGATKTIEGTASHHTIRVDGTLVINGHLQTDTIICDSGSMLDVLPGSRITFTDTGPIDTVRDPFMLSRGLISHGVVRIRGPPVVPDYARAKAWKPGDAVTLERSIVFESAATEVSRRAHIMFMHSGQVSCEGALFLRMGRTDKTRKVTDPDGKGAGLDNPRGRYAVHFHRAGGTKSGTPAVCRGCAVVDGAGWGIVNHSSHVLVEDCETYGIVGAHYVCEKGDELGAFKGNVAIYSKGGTNRAFDDSRGANDWGVRGHGFWIQGGGTVELSDNLACGHKDAGYGYQGIEAGSYPVANLADPSIWTSGATMPSDDVPIRFFRNEGHSNGVDLNIWAIHTNHRHQTDSRVEDCTFKSASPVNLGYSGYIHFKNCSLLGNVNAPKGSGMTNTGASISGMTYENLRVEGFEVGLHNPCTEDGADGKPSRIIGGKYNNVCSILILNTQGRKRTLLIDGTQEYGNLPSVSALRWPRASEGGKQWDVYKAMWFFSWNIRWLEGYPYLAAMPEATWRLLFSPTLIHPLDTVKVGDEQLSFAEFAPDYSLSRLPNLPADLRLKADGTPRTNAELAADKGLRIGGRTIKDPVTKPRIRGVFHKEPAVF